jgi:hypothetical protein
MKIVHEFHRKDARMPKFQRKDAGIGRKLCGVIGKGEIREWFISLMKNGF